MSAQLRTPICDLLGIDVPTMQAGMGQHVAYGLLAGAGGLGTLGELSEVGVEVGPSTDQAISVEDARRKLEISLDHGVEVIACALGTPDWAVETAHAKGAKVMSVVGAAKHARSVRQLRNRFTDVWDGHEDELSPFPLQRVLTAPFRAATTKATSRRSCRCPPVPPAG